MKNFYWVSAALSLSLWALIIYYFIFPDQNMSSGLLTAIAVGVLLLRLLQILLTKLVFGQAYQVKSMQSVWIFILGMGWVHQQLKQENTPQS